MIILISKLLIRKSSLLVRGVVVHVQPVFPLFPRTEIALLNPRHKIRCCIIKARDLFGMKMNVEFKGRYLKTPH